MTKHHNYSIRVCIALLLGLAVWLLPGVSHAATLSLSPSTGVYTAGQTFTTRVLVNTAGSAINAAEATIRFNPNELAVVSVTRGSTFSLWAVEPSYSNSAGTITFGGGSPTGYTGSSGTVITITWRSKAAGTARVTFGNGSILAADGRGTNIVQSLNGGSYTLAAADVQPEPEVIEYIAPANTPGRPSVTSSSHPDEGWSQNTTAELSWTLPPGVTAVRTLLDGNSGSIPTNVYEPPITSISIDELEQGVQYFHLQFRNADGWGRVAHYRLAVDTEAPEQFSITRSEAFAATSPTQELVLDVTDATSPVLRFMVQHNDEPPYEYIRETGTSTLQLENLEPGQNSFIIEAFDAAGNSRVATISFTIEAFTAPVWTEYPSQVSEAVIPVLIGTTRPEAEVFLTVAALGGGEQGAVPQTYQIVANNEGVFRFIPDGRFATGVYEITAYAIDSNGARSAESETIRLAVGPSGLMRVGQWAVSALSVIVPLTALLFLLGFIIVYGLVRYRRIRRYVVAETSDALSVLATHFTALRTTLAEDVSNLEASRKAGKLTKTETQLVEDMQQRIDEAEVAIRKEISEVDDIVSR